MNLSDVLLILALIVLSVTGFAVSTIVGGFVAGGSLLLLSLAFADGKGFPWRS